MSSRTADRVLGWGRIVLAALKGDMKAVLANVAEYTDDDGQPAGGANEQPMFCSVGSYCRPLPEDDRGTCEVVFWREADGATPIAARDLRTTRLVGPEEGALGMAHYGGGFVELGWDADKRGTIVTIRASLCDANLDAVEKAHMFLMNPRAGGDASIQIGHYQGNAIVLDDPGHVTITDKTAKNMIDVGPGGITISSDAGGIKLVGAMVAGDPGSAKKVVLYDETDAILQQILIALSAISAQLTAVPTPGAGIAANISTITNLVTQLGVTGSSPNLKASPT